MPFDLEAPRQAPPTMADCPLFQAHRAAESARLRAKGLLDAGDDEHDHRAWMQDAAERDDELDRLGIWSIRGDRQSITVRSGR